MCAHNGFISAQDNKNDAPHHYKQESDLKNGIFDVQGSYKAILRFLLSLEFRETKNLDLQKKM